MKTTIKKLISRAEKAFSSSNFEESIRFLEEAKGQLPEDNQDSHEALRIYSALGDAHFLLGNYEVALDYLEDAANCGDGFNNPFVLLRRGECCFYLGDHVKASNDIIGAYMLEGEELFEGEPKEIVDFLEKVKNSSSSANFAEPDSTENKNSSVKVNSLFVRWPRNLNSRRMSFEDAQPIYDLMFAGDYEKAWALVPEPRQDWNVGVDVVKSSCSAALKKGNLAEAKEKLEILLRAAYSDIDATPFELGGRIFFELGDFETAFQFFEHLDKNWGKRGFPDDKKYLKFYQDQKALRKKIK